MLNRVGQRLLQLFEGASAAYSLRDLASNIASVVRVRRASDNSEKDFSAADVSSGAMTQWVNSQIVPPLDVRELVDGERTGALIPAAAAYSLRNLSTSYTDNVVEVRRSSDNAEDSFTAAEVADGTLEDWVGADYVKYSSDFTSNDNDWGHFDDVAATGAVDGIGGLDGNLRLAIGSATSPHRAYRNNTLPENQEITFSARVFIPSTNSVVDGIGLFDAAGNTIINAESLTQDQWVTVTANDVTTANSQLRINLLDGSSTSFTGNSSDVVYVREITVTQTTANGHVSQWYDQSGNANHATQATDASQPKIVDAGTLVSGGLDFDGVDDSFTLTSGLTIDPSTSGFSSFIATKFDKAATGSAQVFLRNNNSNPKHAISFNTSGTFRYNLNDGTNNLFADTGSDYGDNSLSLFSTIITGQSATGLTHFVDGSQDGQFDTSLIGDTGSTADAISWPAFPFGGVVQEIIFYPSDQSANRTAFEANIGETYGIDLPSGVDTGYDQVDGFVETWYDQSGNGNDAVQETASQQPKIVSGGSLVSGGIDFDGVDDVLGTSLVPPNVATLIGVANWDVEDQATMIIGARDSTNKRSYLSQASSGRSAIGVANSALLDVNVAAGDDYLLFGIYSSSTLLLSTNGTVASDSPTIAPNNTVHGYSVGALNTAGTDSSFMDGTIAEVIIYDSDQSANRVAIETNINNQYDIY